MKNATKWLVALLAILLAFSCVACGSANANDTETVSFTFEVVYEDDTSKTFEIETSETKLANALAEEGLITYDVGGLYTTIDGVTAEWSDDQAWWCITKDGEMTDKGLNDLDIADGDHYEATYTNG